jgi:uncharacterized protein
MRLAAFFLAMLAAAPAFAQAQNQNQSGPSFDCAKASTVIERAICKDAALARDDRALAAAYKALFDRVGAPAKEALEKDQVQWIAARNRACQREPDAVSYCLKQRYVARLDTLRAMGEGRYPFVATQSITKSATVGKISYAIDIRYPQFDGRTADFAAVNRAFADDARKSAGEGTPQADSGIDREQQWTYEQDFALYRPAANAVTVAVNFYGYSGGAHGYGATRCTLVDLGTGTSVPPQGVFAPGDQWLKELVQLVAANLKKQFVDNPGFDDALQPKSLAKLLGDAGRYCYRRGKLELIFNAYDVGPYSAGSYTVDIPYDRLKTVLRPDGPLSNGPLSAGPTGR